MIATSAIRSAIAGERCSRVIFGEKVKVAFCRSFRPARGGGGGGGGGGGAPALRECIPIGLGLGGVFQQLSC